MGHRRSTRRRTAGGVGDPSGPWERQLVFFRSNESPGTIVVHTAEKHLYVVQGNNRAIRYGIGVGRDGFQWKGLVSVVRKQEWPDWRPPPEMIQRQPYLPRFMAGGPAIPWAPARSISAARSIGSTGPISPTRSARTSRLAASALSIPDVIDLYDRVPVGTKVIVRQAATI